MEDLKLFEFYKELYEHEVMIRNYYDGKIGFTFTVLSVTAGAIANNFIVCYRDEIELTFSYILLYLSIAIFIMQLYFAFNAYYSFKFKYMDFPVDLIKEDIKKYMLKTAHNKSVDEFEQDINNYIEGMLFRTYEKCASTYYKVNIEKRKAHHILNLMTIINFLIIIAEYVLVKL